MADPFNPYAPPVAEVDKAHQVGVVSRDGVLVRMERDGQLPDRCVGCNAPAVPARVTRTLFWSHWQWRLAAWGLPAILVVFMSSGSEFAMGLFFPAILVLVIANMIVRKRMAIEIGLCERHARMRGKLFWLATASLVAMVALPFGVATIGLERAGIVFLVILGLMLVSGVAFAYAPANRIGIKRLTLRHVWLKGAGASFRDSLPEASPE